MTRSRLPHPRVVRARPVRTVHATFTPADASVNVANAVCVLDDGLHSAATKVTGIGKYPYLKLSDTEIDFGEVLVGRTVEEEIRVTNQSIVGVSYAVERGAAEHDHVYRVSAGGSGSGSGGGGHHNSGHLAPETYDVVKVSFTPAMTGTFTANRSSLSLRAETSRR